MDQTNGVPAVEGTTTPTPPVEIKPADESTGATTAPSNEESGITEPSIPKSRFDEVYEERKQFKEEADKAKAELQRIREEKLKAEGKESELYQEKLAKYVKQDYSNSLNIVDKYEKIPSKVRESIKAKPFAFLTDVDSKEFEGLSPVEQMEKAAQIITTQMPSYLEEMEKEYAPQPTTQVAAGDSGSTPTETDKNADLGNSATPGSNRIFRSSEVIAMDVATYRKLKPEIDRAILEGRYVQE